VYLKYLIIFVSFITTKKMENRFLNLIENSIKTHWNSPVFSDYEGKTFLYKDMAKEIEKIHILFREMGIEKQDKISLIGRNSSHWGIAFFAILSYGAVAVPLLHDFTPDNVHHLVNHSESKILFVAKHNWKSLKKEEMPDLKLHVLMEDFSIIDNKNIAPDFPEKQFIAKYPDFSPDDISYHIEKPDELAIINYTSGTTGYSKGVMIPFRSLWSNTQYAYDNLDFIHSGDHFVSLLPMAHMYGLAFEILNGINKGCHIHFLPRIPSPNIVVKSFAHIKPALIIAVPLIIEKVIRNRVFPFLEKQPVKFLYKIPGIKKLINKKILKQLDEAFGGKFEEIIIGGAAFNQEIETFLKQIKFRYTVGYGMTECGPIIGYEKWDTFRQNSVGKVVERMEIKIDSKSPGEVGEVMVKGMNVMLGYYKNEKATKEVLTEDGWLRTGDLGLIDKDNFIFLKGRNKTMLLSSNGQNIYPEEIESVLNNMPYVAESLIVSREDNSSVKQIYVALIFPDKEQIKKDNITEDKLSNLMQKNILNLNNKIPYYSKISSFELMEQEFEKTPKRSIRRFLYK
jgi:long-chain acyl-CoA synthetase